MEISSLFYLAFLVIGGAIYYLLPKKLQWVQLLVMSLAFGALAALPYTLIYPLCAALIAYFCTNSLPKLREKNEKCAEAVCTVSILVIIALWLVIKATDLWVPVSARLNDRLRLLPRLHALPLAAALGMGYYTAQIISYIIDCKWGSIEPEKNFLKLFLYVYFFPQLITGPITRFSQFRPIYEGQSFRYENICRGAQRILWGFFKKLVLAERIAVIVNAVYSGAAGNIGELGFYSWIALLLYPMQLYTDFSGCMDIVLGASELFGITLPENFRNPLFSLRSQACWQRWHITLGTWAKDYVLYPLLKTKAMVAFGKKAKKRFGKKTGKLLPTIVCMFVLWMVMGVWHGGYKYILGVSLWYWVILMLGEILEQPLKKLRGILGVREDSFGFRLFCRVRTYLIYAGGVVFFRTANPREALDFFGSVLSVFAGKANPWIFFDGSIEALGVSAGELNVLVIGLALLLAVGVLRERYGYARDWMAKQGITFRYIVWLGLLVLTVVWGMYGPGYDAAEFIYAGF